MCVCVVCGCTAVYVALGQDVQEEGWGTSEALECPAVVRSPL